MNYLVVDYGTSSCRTSIVDDFGCILTSCRKANTAASGEENALLNTDDAWASVSSAIREIISANPKVDIAAVGVSAMLGWVFLDSSEKAIGNCINWMDRRCGRGLHAKLDRDGLESYGKTGRRFSNELLLSKWSWMQENEPEVTETVSRVISLKDEFVRRLTGVIVSDLAHMNYTMLWNIRDNRLDQDMLDLAEVPANILPPALYPFERAGVVTVDAAEVTGLKQGLPVIVGSLDGTTAMYGGGMAGEGRTVHVAGTTDVLMTLVRDYPQNIGKSGEVLTVNNGLIPDTFAVGGATGTSGGALMKIMSLLDGEPIELLEKAALLPPGACGLLLCPGFSGERAPYWNDAISGSIIGLRMKHGPEHIVRAAMEGAAFRLKRLSHELFNLTGRPKNLFIAGGGALNDCWNTIKADVTSLAFTRLAEIEATTIGTAMFCACFCRNTTDLSEIGKQWHKSEVEYSVSAEHSAVYDELFRIWEDYINDSAETSRVLGAVGGTKNG